MFHLRTALCLTFFLAFSRAFAAEEKGLREREFVRALELFDKAKTPDEFRAAAQLFESLLGGGYQNGAVNYNAGNAYMRAGEFGRAISCYRKAARYRPRDTFLDANLRQALAAAPGRLADPPAPWWKHVLFWSGWLSYPEKVYLAFGAWSLSAATVLAGIIWRRKRLYWLAAAAGLAAAVFSLDATLAWLDATSGQHAVVTAEAIARKGIGENYEAAFDKPLKDGAEFTIVARNGEWVLGHFEGIGDGWLKRENIVE